MIWNCPVWSGVIEAVPAGQSIRLPVEQPIRSGMAVPPPPLDLGLLRWLPIPAEAPPPRQDGSARIQHAIGEINEIRAILRQCLDEEIPFDQVEVIHTDAETYVPLIYELCERHTLPATFAEGIPVRYAKPGRALQGWLRWMREDFTQTALLSLIQEGLLQLPLKSMEMDESGFARLLRSLPIGFGRERYEKKIQDEIRAVEIRLADPERSSNEEREENRDSRDWSGLEKRRDHLCVLRQFISGLLEMTPRADDPDEAVLRQAGRFLETFARAVTEFDRHARQRLLESIRRLREWLPSRGRIRSWTRGMAGRFTGRTAGHGANAPGREIARVASARRRPFRRPYTFIVGLDDSRFPGAAGRSHPAGSRAGGYRLKFPRVTPASKLEAFHRLLCRSKAGWSSASRRMMSTMTGRCSQPRGVGRLPDLSGEAEGDQSTLMKWLPPPRRSRPPAWRLRWTEANGGWRRSRCALEGCLPFEAVDGGIPTWRGLGGAQARLGRCLRSSTAAFRKPEAASAPPARKPSPSARRCWKPWGSAPCGSSSATALGFSRRTCWRWIRNAGWIRWLSDRCCTRCSSVLRAV